MRLSIKAISVTVPYLLNERIICSSSNIGLTTRYKKGLVVNFTADNYDSGFEIKYIDDCKFPYINYKTNLTTTLIYSMRRANN